MTEVKSYEQQNIRLLAVKALSDINRNGAYANIKLQEYLQKYHLSDLDRRLLSWYMVLFVEKIILMPLLFTLQNDLSRNYLQWL